MSLTELARVAKQMNRSNLASQLLDQEVQVGDQVQLLLEMNEMDKALDKAINSWDAQLGMDNRILYMYTCSKECQVAATL